VLRTAPGELLSTDEIANRVIAGGHGTFSVDLVFDSKRQV
jgi:hypothetical protein